MTDQPHDHNYEPIYGGCPESGCGKVDRCLDIGPNHYLVCDQHRTQWRIGSNISRWYEGTREEWERNAALIEDYLEVLGVSVCTICGKRTAWETCDIPLQGWEWERCNPPAIDPDEDDVPW